MNIGAEIPFRRSRRDRQATGSLIFDLGRKEHLRENGESASDQMRVWSNGHFRKA